MNRELGDNNLLIQEAEVPKPRYPWYIIFILGNEFCERFTYYGMKTVLILFLTRELLFSEDNATFFYHLFSMLCYFLPVLGAWLADSLIGKFRTILSLSLVYILGLVVLMLAAMPPVPVNAVAATMGGLMLIAVGTGGIKPCVSTYGADQFKVGEERHRERFFAYFYFCINAGSFISTFVAPILRSDVQCFENRTCSSLAFGVFAALMAVALIIFLLGKPFYTDTPIYRSLISRVICCVCISSDHVSESLRSKVMSIWKGKRRADTTHWLDAAVDKYDKTMPTVLGADRTELRIFNSNPCSLALSGRMFQYESQNMGPYSMVHIPSFATNGANETLLRVSSVDCPNAFAPTTEVRVSISGGTGYLVFLGIQNGQLTHEQLEAKNIKPDEGSSRALFILPFAPNTTSGTGNITLVNPKIAEDMEGHQISILVNSSTGLLGSENCAITAVAVDVDQGPYAITYLSNRGSHFGSDPMDTDYKQIDFPVGGYYVVLLKDPSSSVAANDSSWERYTIFQPNSVSIFWQFPQYFVITLAEVFLTVSGLSFAYSEAPESMRSVMQAAWLLTSAFGSVIVMIFSGGRLIASQAVEFFVFAGLIGIIAITFAIMSHFYHYLKPSEIAIELTERRDGDALHKKDDSYQDSHAKEEAAL